MSERQGGSWPVVFGAAAERDFADILVWTAQQFGPRQAEAYRAQLQALIVGLTAGTDQLGVKARDEIGPDLKTLHIRSIAKRGSHFAQFRAVDAEIQVLRILHERMVLARHLPDDDGA